MKQHLWLTFLPSVFSSASISALSPVLTSDREPWDTEGQFYIAALLIAGAVAGAIAPKPLWAHYLRSLAGQLGYEMIFTPRRSASADRCSALAGLLRRLDNSGGPRGFRSSAHCEKICPTELTYPRLMIQDCRNNL